LGITAFSVSDKRFKSARNLSADRPAEEKFVRFLKARFIEICLNPSNISHNIFQAAEQVVAPDP
jgi:hypothetical protein